MHSQSSMCKKTRYFIVSWFIHELFTFKSASFVVKTSNILSRFSAHINLSLNRAILLSMNANHSLNHIKNVFFRIFRVFLRGSEIRVFYSIFE
jgi:hypothetical protein